MQTTSAVRYSFGPWYREVSKEVLVEEGNRWSDSDSDRKENEKGTPVFEV